MVFLFFLNEVNQFVYNKNVFYMDAEIPKIKMRKEKGKKKEHKLLCS